MSLYRAENKGLKSQPRISGVTVVQTFNKLYLFLWEKKIYIARKKCCCLFFTYSRDKTVAAILFSIQDPIFNED